MPRPVPAMGVPEATTPGKRAHPADRGVGGAAGKGRL